MTRLLFFGTPNYVLPVLDALNTAGYEIAAVVTQSPKPVGRKKIITSSPVAQWAKNHLVQSIETSPKEMFNQLKSLNTTLAILAAYGRILPLKIVHLFEEGIINIHPSLLPQWRGPSPIEATMLSGAYETGVTFIKLDEEMDHGPIIHQSHIANIHTVTNKEELRTTLFKYAAQELIKLLPHYLNNKLKLREQNHNEATYTTLIKREDGFIPPEHLKKASTGELDNKSWEISWMMGNAPKKKPYSFKPDPWFIQRFIETLSPWPGGYTNITINNQTKQLRILKTHLEKQEKQYDKYGWDKVLEARLVLDQVQLEGKNPVTWKQFQEGYPNLRFETTR